MGLDRVPDEEEVDFYIVANDDTRIQEKLQLEQRFFKRFKPTMAEVLVKLLKLFACKLAEHSCQFNIKKTKLKVKPSKLFISIKDPFIKGLNHGKYLRDK